MQAASVLDTALTLHTTHGTSALELVTGEETLSGATVMVSFSQTE